MPRSQPTDEQTEYCRLALNDFVGGKLIPFPVYIRLSDSKFIRIAHTAADIDPERLTAYREKRLLHLYLEREDFKKYLETSLNISHQLANTTTVSDEKRLRFLKHTSDVILECAFVEGVNKETFQAAKSFVTAAMDAVSRRDDLISLLGMLNQHADFLYAHCLGTALYGVMIAQQLGWDSSPTTYKVMLCGLFHDVGMKELDAELIKLPRIRLNHVQRAIVETHCKRGAEIMASVPGVPFEISQVAYQHHETWRGTGYPSRLKRSELTPLGQVISVANVFCEFAIKGPDHPNAMSAAQAIERMEQFDLDLKFFGALKDSLVGTAD